MSFLPADDAFLDSVIDVANAMRFIAFTAQLPDAKFQVLPGRNGFMVATQQGIATMWRDTDGVTGSMEPDPVNGTDFGDVAFHLPLKPFANAKFMRETMMPTNGNSPAGLHAFADGYNAIQRNGQIMAHKYAHGQFGIIVARQPEDQQRISLLVEDLARGMDALSGNENRGFNIHLRSPAFGQPGDISPADPDGKLYRAPSLTDPDPRRVALGKRLNMLAKLANERPAALQVLAPDQGKSPFRVLPLSYSYALPAQSLDAREKGEQAFIALRDHLSE